MLCQYFSDNFTSLQLHEISTQNDSYYITIIYFKKLTFKEYFIWICCVNIFQITLQAYNCMKYLRKMTANQIAEKQGQ